MTPLEDIRNPSQPSSLATAKSWLKWEIIEFNQEIEELKAQVQAAKRGQRVIFPPTSSPDENDQSPR